MEFVKIGEKDSMILLADQNGNKAYFDFLEMIVVDGLEYAALLQQGEDDVILLRFEENRNGKEIYSVIEDDALFEKVAEAFDALLDED